MGSIICCSTIERLEESESSSQVLHLDEKVPSLGNVAREASTLTIFPRGT
jgi:hypothetical protein